MNSFVGVPTFIGGAAMNNNTCQSIDTTMANKIINSRSPSTNFWPPAFQLSLNYFTVVQVLESPVLFKISLPKTWQELFQEWELGIWLWLSVCLSIYLFVCGYSDIITEILISNLFVISLKMSSLSSSTTVCKSNKRYCKISL